MTKDMIRAAAKARRRSLSRDEVAEMSRCITERLMPLLKDAGTVMCYLSAFNEPDTEGIISSLLSHGKRVVVPVTDTNTCTITPSYLTSLDGLVRGSYGIAEPSQCVPAKTSDIDISVVPGIAFDRSGMRIGFGKGYYDRFLSEFNGHKIGLCYDFQLYDSVPHDEHDIPMDIIITEGNIYNDL